ncbi:alpha-amylase family glycosyl hydrolase [Vaginella massiliensis]|uniref:alpha-amylase family glycosyl hydrolase n=1 Tax=Vaginella massiliensis TaxID=1816680 RepID=UPI0008392403|nr:alpha-amylase family glycosyl hydrolase [Vaginella massiliensis]
MNKKHIIIATALIFGVTMSSCTKETVTEKGEQKQKNKEAIIAPYTANMAETAIIYEVNVRQFSPEGTFAAVTKEISNIKKLGVKILWLMPIHPIGEEKRQDDLGSYYSIKDYRKINPEFGTADDLKALIAEAHKNGIYVVMDWVANQTAWDHIWMKTNPEFYEKNDKDEFVSPKNQSDVVTLDYDNPALRKAMIAEMKYWLDEFKIDGFHCAMADKIPTEFWTEAKQELTSMREIFMLGQTEEPELLKAGVFDAAYGWELYHIMNDIAKGKKNVSAIDLYLDSIQYKWEQDDYKMLFTTNHNENSRVGTEYERMGDAVEIFAALTYALPSVPLIYNGQEEDFNRRLKLFEKDSIDRNPTAKMRGLYEKLGELKITNEAFNGGKNAGTYERIKTSDDKAILAFKRQKNNTEAYFIGNLSKTNKEVILPINGTFKNFMKGDELKLEADQKLSLKPWQYYILVQK